MLTHLYDRGNLPSSVNGVMPSECHAPYFNSETNCRVMLALLIQTFCNDTRDPANQLNYYADTSSPL